MMSRLRHISFGYIGNHVVLLMHSRVDRCTTDSTYRTSQPCCTCRNGKTRTNYYITFTVPAVISLASVFKFESLRTSTRVSQVTGCLPVPCSHSRRMAMFIASASSLWWRTSASTLDPVSSLSRNTPNALNLVLIFWGMLMLPCVLGNLRSSVICGRVSVDKSISGELLLSGVQWNLFTFKKL